MTASLSRLWTWTQLHWWREKLEHIDDGVLRECFSFSFFSTGRTRIFIAQVHNLETKCVVIPFCDLFNCVVFG